jgi:predicted RNase H-like HicB family nuclease
MAEVQVFASRIGATRDSTYGQSCFSWNGRRLFITISRQRLFWGVKAAALNSLRQQNQPYVLALLTTDQHGWFFTDDQFTEKVKTREIRVAKDGYYKISGMLPPDNEFRTAAEFCEKLGVREGANMRKEYDFSKGRRNPYAGRPPAGRISKETKMRDKPKRMRNEFTAVIERDGNWYVAYCPEIPGANGQGRTKAEARRSLADAIALILDDRRKDGLRGVPRNAVREKVVVG